MISRRRRELTVLTVLHRTLVTTAIGISARPTPESRLAERLGCKAQSVQSAPKARREKKVTPVRKEKMERTANPPTSMLRMAAIPGPRRISQQSWRRES